MKRETFYGICAVAGLLFGLSIVGSMDYQDEQQNVKAYCDGVRQNLHPDYNRNFDKLCINK